MNIIEAVYRRRSVKRFDKDHMLSDAEERKLLEATIQAPTSFNIQHWRFVILRDPELRKKIRENFCAQPQTTDASLLVLFTADIKAWQKSPERYWQNASEEISHQVVKAIGPFHQGREHFQRDEAQRSIGMAMQTLMLVAQDLGYQSCPMIGYDIEAVAKLINLPEGYVMGPMVAIGKGTKDPWPKPGQLPLDEVVYENTF